MLRRAAGLLNESVMGFLALAALAVGTAPMLFALDAGIAYAFSVAEWGIVGLFALEYAANLALAGDRGAFVRDPWRLLDIVIILAPLASLLPGVLDAARSSPALRILRLLRAILFGARAGHGGRRPVVTGRRAEPVGPPRVTVLAQGETSARTGEWNTLLAWAASPAPEWHHASGLAADRLEEVASASGVSHALVEAALHESSYPRIESGARWTALTVSLPDPEDVLRRDPILLLVSGSDILSLVRHPLDLPEPPAGPGALAWGPRCALHVLGRVLDRNEDLAGRLEREVRALEELPAAESPAQFFEQTFRLKRSLSTAKGDLWRLRGLLEMLADGRRTLPGLGPEQGTLLRRLAEQADYLYETVDGILDALLSLIDLHINIAAHDMNRFMRLLAIVSALALIPAITGGLLGMNLGDSPWPMTLGQVAFCTLILMLGVLYAFQAKGWIR